MPIPLFVVGAKCSYLFSAQNLPPGLSIQNNLITGKVSVSGSWEVRLTAFPSDLRYPVLQKSFTITVGEKITREVMQDLVTYQEITANASNESIVELAIVNTIEARASIFGEIYLDILGQATERGEVNPQKVFEINGIVNAVIVIDRCPVPFYELNRSLRTIIDPVLGSTIFFYELNRSLRTIVDPLLGFTNNFVQNNPFFNGSQVNYFNLGTVCSAPALNRSQVNYFSLSSLWSAPALNRSEVTARQMLPVISSLFTNQSQVNLLTDSRPKLELIESKVRNLSQVNLNR
ncbi:MAG TPA: hypothetical protein VIQ31_35770 [Phormidium sp.]